MKRNNNKRFITLLSFFVMIVVSALAATPAQATVYCTGSCTSSGISTVDQTGGVTPTDLVNNLLGPGVTISNVTYNGAPAAAGTFSGGTGIIGFENGIILSSGKISTVIGPNDVPDATTSWGTAGDPDLNTLIPGYTTFDAATLEFDFVPQGNVVTFNYVFGSEEYNEYVNSQFNNVFGFFLNGQNIALIPGTTTPVAINNVNNGNPCPVSGQPPTASNPAYFIDNGGCNPSSATLNTQMDGLIVVLPATASVKRGQTNHIKLAIADAGDSILDSDVFIQAGSFVSFNLTLEPLTATNPIDSTHTLTAKLIKPDGSGIPNETITFTVTAGPNAGLTGTAVTDVNGEATFSYTGTIIGTDTIIAEAKDLGLTTDPVEKIWTGGSISGVKFNDLNGNGVNDAEPGLANWTITLTNESGSVVTQTTAPDGSYNFTNLTDGNYTVGEVLQNSWIQTAPAVSTTGAATYTVNISGGNNVAGKDFGNFQFGSVSGTKFEDLNANGVRDPNESGLAGWNITINGTDSITGTTVNQTTTTDANGNYNFTGLTAGTYTISETLKTGWVQTAPAAGIYMVTITSEAVITGQDFGNFHKGKITGGGWINITGDPKATFGIVGQYPDASNTANGSVEYQDHIAKLNIKSIQINTVATTLDKKKGAITGLAQVNGAGSYPFVVYVEDNAEPGKGADVFMISLPTYPYSNGTILSGGNIQIHS